MLVELDLHVYAGRQLQLHQRVHRLVGGIQDVHQALVRAQLELVTRVLVAVRRDQHGELLHLGRQRHRATHSGAGTLGGLDDFLRRVVDQAMIECLQANADVLVCHVGLLPYFRIFETTPAPTVLPPSRMAKRRPASMAMGAISSTVILMLSPGITISAPPSSSTEPVTSVVRK